MSEEKPGQYLTIRQDKNPGAFGKWSIPGLEQSFPLIATKLLLFNFCDLWCSE